MTDEFSITDHRTWPEFLTTAQVAAVLQTHPNSVMALMRDGLLAHVQLGTRTFRVTKASLMDLVKQGGIEDEEAPASD